MRERLNHHGRIGRPDVSRRWQRALMGSVFLLAGCAGAAADGPVTVVRDGDLISLSVSETVGLRTVIEALGHGDAIAGPGPIDSLSVEPVRLERMTLVEILGRIVPGGNFSIRMSAETGAIGRIALMAGAPSGGGEAQVALAPVVARPGDAGRAQRLEEIARLSEDHTSQSLQSLRSIATSDPDVTVKASAVQALGNFADMGALRVLESILRSNQDIRVRMAAADTIQFSQSADASGIIESVMKTERDAQMRSHLRDLLGLPPD